MPDIPQEFKQAIYELLSWAIALQKRQRALEKLVMSKVGITEEELTHTLKTQGDLSPGSPWPSAQDTGALEHFLTELRKNL